MTDAEQLQIEAEINPTESVWAFSRIKASQLCRDNGFYPIAESAMTAQAIWQDLRCAGPAHTVYGKIYI